MADNLVVGDTGGDGSGSGGGDRYFCYQCEKEVAVAGIQDAMTCAECDGGFVEVMAAAAPEFRRQPRRRRRRGHTHDSIPLSDALDHIYPQQMLQMVQMLLDASRGNNRQGGGGGASAAAAMEVENGGPSHSDSGVEEGELVARSGAEETGAATTENDGRVVMVREPHDDNDEEHESDSETGGLRLELEGFDLNEDDDEWEEAEEEENDVGVVTHTARYETNAASDEHEHEHEHEHDHGGGGAREETVARARNHLTFYIREIFQNLLEQNLEVRLELPDMYLGNPGDYLDSRGFEQLLQQLAENDNSRRGAPPAAKSAVDKLEMVKIAQHHIDSGIAVCAICKEQLMLDEPAKQLPCLHLYHQDCILPWLSSRNSCPVCRYELPTDDPDYEEQKKSRRAPDVDGTTTTTTTTMTSTSTTSTMDDGNNNNSTTGTGSSGESSGVSSEESCLACQDHREEVCHDHHGEEVCQDHGAEDHSAEVCQDQSAEVCLSEGVSQEHSRGLPDEEEEEACVDPSEEDESKAAVTSGGAGGFRGISRSWLILAVGPVLSVMGFVFISLANQYFVGRQADRVFEMFHSNDVPQRHWWFY